MRILLASYQSLFLNRGGPTYKVMMMKKALADKDIDVDYFDYWDKNLKLDNDTLVHLFNASLSTYPLALNLKTYGAKYVVNPIFFSNHSASKIKSYLRIENIVNRIMKRSYSDYYCTGEVCRNAEKILPNTQAEGDLLSGVFNFSDTDVEVIHNGVEKRFADADSDLFIKKYGIRDFILNVGHLGSLRKNGVNMLQALKQIDAPVVVIADILKTEEGRQCQDIIEQSDNIIHIPWIKHDDPLLESAYAASKVFALPTRYETPGRAALEAGLAGANVVITPRGGTKEYFLDNALYCNPDSIRSIKETIEKSLELPRNSKLSVHIMENFIWDKIVDKTIKIYQDL